MGGLQSSTLISQCTPAGRAPSDPTWPLSSPTPPAGVPRPRPSRGSDAQEVDAGDQHPRAPSPGLPRPRPGQAQEVDAGDQPRRAPSPGVAEPTLRAAGARTLVGVGEVDAGATVPAGLGQALVHLLGAVHPMVAGHTLQGDSEVCAEAQRAARVWPSTP